MEKLSFTLTKNEQEIMEVMWTHDKSLTRSEIIDLSTDRSWKENSIHILLNSLLDKGAIKVDGYARTGKNYGRTYTTAVTQDEYQVMMIQKGMPYLNSKSSSITNIVSALITEDIDNETLDKLEAILQARRNEKK